MVQPQTLEEKHDVCFPGSWRALGRCLVHLCAAGGRAETVICVGTGLLNGFVSSKLTFHQHIGRACLHTSFTSVPTQLLDTRVWSCIFTILGSLFVFPGWGAWNYKLYFIDMFWLLKIRLPGDILACTHWQWAHNWMWGGEQCQMLNGLHKAEKKKTCSLSAMCSQTSVWQFMRSGTHFWPSFLPYLSFLFLSPLSLSALFSVVLCHHIDTSHLRDGASMPRYG